MIAAFSLYNSVAFLVTSLGFFALTSGVNKYNFLVAVTVNCITPL